MSGYCSGNAHTHTRGPIINTWIYFSFCPWINSAINLTPQTQKKSYCPGVYVWILNNWCYFLLLSRSIFFFFALDWCWWYYCYRCRYFWCCRTVLLEDCSRHLTAICHFKAIEKDYFLKWRRDRNCDCDELKRKRHKWNRIGFWWWLKLLLLLQFDWPLWKSAFQLFDWLHT